MADQTASSNTETMLWPSNFQRPGYGFAGWNTAFDMSGTNYGPMESITTPDLTTSSHLSATTDPTSTAWCTDDSGTCDDQSMLSTNNTTLAGTTANSMKNPSGNTYSYGNYYNWYSATAGNGKYENGSGYIAPGDICPSGWRLPIGAKTTVPKSFGALSVALGGPADGGQWILLVVYGISTRSFVPSVPR